LFGFFNIFFSPKVIFKLKVVWQNMAQNFEFIIFLMVSGVRTRDLAYIYALSINKNFEFIMN